MLGRGSQAERGVLRWAEVSPALGEEDGRQRFSECLPSPSRQAGVSQDMQEAKMESARSQY